jgi:t-SNARE complex subunit (syntaxin)
MRPTLPRLVLTAVMAATLVLAGCQTTYYKAMEAVGKHKRDLLVERVEAAQAEQGAAKEQFASALEQFSALVGFDGGDLQEAYDKARSAYERSKSRAAEVTERIDSVESVGDDLFAEWKSELKQYSSDDLRRASQAQMEATRERYDDLLRAMRRAEKSMAPVLSAFSDQVLFLKHNLNARAIASLQGSLADLQTDIAKLMQEMEASISEAERFVREMRSNEPAGSP